MHSEELKIHPRIVHALEIIMKYVVQQEDILDNDKQETQDISNKGAWSTAHAQIDASGTGDHASQTPENPLYQNLASLLVP